VDGKKNKRIIILSLLLGFLAAFPFMAAAGFLYLRYGHPPVATADTPFPYEETIVHIPLDARIDRQLAAPPFGPTPDNLIAGAHVYVAHCAVCHGTPGQNSTFGQSEYPTAPQLWVKKASGVVGVSDDQPGVSDWKVDNGVRLTGMPSFTHILTQQQMWQVSLLIAQAGNAQPAAVTQIFTEANSLRDRSEAEQMQGSAPAPATSK
jgi:thiosulfate dehydrogenase